MLAMNASNIQPVALSPADAARYLSISRRSLSRLIASGQVIAKKMPGGRTARTLVDFDSLRSYYASMPSRVPPAPAKAVHP
jgi:hypothetical protein